MHLYNFEFRQLEYFIAVADQGSFTRAAELLFVTQPLISQQINNLERQLGADLFVRQHHSLQLTPAGTILYPEAKRILSQSGALLHNIQRSQTPELEYTLRVGFEDLFNWSNTIEPFELFQQKNPKIKYRVFHDSYRVVIRNLLDGELDIAFVLLPNKHINKNLCVQVVYEETLCLAASRTLSQGKTYNEFILQLSEKPLLLIDGDYRGINTAIHLCVNLNVAPQFHFEEDMQSIILNVAVGNGLAIFPSSTFAHYNQNILNIKELSGTLDSRLCLSAIWLQSNTNPVIKHFLTYYPNINYICKDCHSQCSLAQRKEES